VLPEAIGKVTVVAGLDESMVEEATAIALAGRVVR
jgi:hypothetical protein